jgi:hypothetical protein
MTGRRLLVGLGALGAVLAAVTLVALEGEEVVQVRTTTPEGGVRVTRTWIADAGGASWLEAATPDRPFLRDVEQRPEVELVRGGSLLTLRAVPVPGDAGHRTIRRLLAEKYGWADTWIGMLTDTSHSVAVRLVPRTP